MPPVPHEVDYQELFSIFEGGLGAPQYEFVDGKDVPEPYRTLLVHEDHMTVTMEGFYHEKVELRVVDVSRKENLYARKILLTAGDTGKVIQFGIMRFNFDYCSDAVRDEILEGVTPLGYILIKHNLLRRIDVHHFLRMQPNDEVTSYFQIKDAGPTYGRLATIFCNEKPAVELLEVASPEV
ncbi:MAG: hypothetical protein O3B01_03725 [Planctomycetota bacterium]|nr:hypothetical protein [Planctomycetota bacterium]MDA1137670.1 hypothetical protein [Planctomycetota bacterium]